jgi:hypothetical protein
MSERTIWSLRERIVVGIWKRYKIGDRALDIRLYYFPSSRLFQTCDEKLNKRTNDILEDEHLVNFVHNGPAW